MRAIGLLAFLLAAGGQLTGGPATAQSFGSGGGGGAGSGFSGSVSSGFVSSGSVSSMPTGRGVSIPRPVEVAPPVDRRVAPQPSGSERVAPVSGGDAGAADFSRALAAEDLRRIDPAVLAPAYDVSVDDAKLLQNLQLGIGGVQGARLLPPVQGSDNIGISIGASTLTVDKTLLPALAPALPAFVKAALGDSTILIRHGDPVDDVPAEVLPVPVVGGGEGSAGSGGGVGQPARVCASEAECLLPTVALHSRHRVFCSGALIAPKWVLTAAHCLCGPGITHATAGSRVPLGNGASTPRDTVTVSLSRRKVFFDDRFCPAFRTKPDDVATYALTDLALVELTNPLQAGTVSPFATIGRPEEASMSSILQIAGFGARENDVRGGEKYVAGIAVSSVDCTEVLDDGHTAAARFGCVAGRELVAIDGSLRKDSCHGDSGAPTYTRLSDGRLVVVAIVSRGLLVECGPGGIYTLVAADRAHEWIRKHVPEAVFSEGTVAVAAEFTTNNPG